MTTGGPREPRQGDSGTAKIRAFVSDVSLTGSATPEPVTFVLIGGGLIGLWSIGKRKRRA